MSLPDALSQQYPGIIIGPGLSPDDECVVAGGRIVRWNRPEIQPDEADVLAAFDAVAFSAARRRVQLSKAITDEADRRILALYPISRQNNIAAAIELLDCIAIHKIGKALGLADVIAVYQPVVDAVGEVFPDDAAANVTAGLVAWREQVSPIRAASAAIQADLAETTDADLQGFDLKGHPAWP